MSPTETDAPKTPDVTQPARKTGMSGDTKFMIAALGVIVLGGGILFGINRITEPPPPPPPPSTIPVTAQQIDGMFDKARHRKGDAGATLTMVEYADFQCPSCRLAYKDTISKFETTIPSYRLGFRHLPLPAHERAVPAAVAVEAAAKQGKFWEMYALLFDPKSESLSDAEIAAAAKSLGLDAARFAADSKNDKPLRDLINDDMQSASENRVDSTPTFFIHDKVGNTAVLSGAGNLKRISPDLKDGVIGNDAIEPLLDTGGVPIVVNVGGKREER